MPLIQGWFLMAGLTTAGVSGLSIVRCPHVNGWSWTTAHRVVYCPGVRYAVGTLVRAFEDGDALMAEFKVGLPGGKVVKVDADTFEIGTVDSMRGPTHDGPLAFFKQVPASTGRQTVAVFRVWESVELGA